MAGRVTVRCLLPDRPDLEFPYGARLRSANLRSRAATGRSDRESATADPAGLDGEPGGGHERGPTRVKDSVAVGGLQPAAPRRVRPPPAQPVVAIARWTPPGR